ncbi:MAG: diguanylate cyclase [Proteobacteria bacterium]|nr:diguanylate cyclase [Pseudomonadota bacterium]MBU1714919.1 diguanylate cyclase [Pseudomonadota bacterium]
MTITNKKETTEKPKILIVDDDPLVLELLGISIASFGYEFIEATDGLIAIEKLKNNSFTMVITDMMMPNMDGMQLLNHIHAHYPKLGVIVVTGYTGTFSYTDVIRAGASDFISKPFNTDELEAKINRILREQSLISKLEHLSNCDPLTDLYNRRYFDEKLNEEVHRANRQGYPLFLALLDVDKFKPYNDAYGHQAGDKALRAISKILRHCTRDNVDWTFRYGGDEFAIITPHITREQATNVGQRIIECYRKCNFDNTGISVGLAELIRHKDASWEGDIHDLIARADKALYRAKDNGKNQIVHDET